MYYKKKKRIEMSTKKKVYKQMKAIKVSDDVKLLMDEVRKIVAVETKGEIFGINEALRYVLQAKLAK
jgi:hypothetical protein